MISSSNIHNYPTLNNTSLLVFSLIFHPFFYMALAMVKKPSKGHRKIEISKIPKKNHLQVTFSKHRSGLFKKASELCTLSGANVAIIVFSPIRKGILLRAPGRRDNRRPVPYVQPSTGAEWSSPNRCLQECKCPGAQHATHTSP